MRGLSYEGMDLTSTVAIVKFDRNSEAKSLEEALRLMGGIDDLNTSEKAVVVKVGVFSHKARAHRRPQLTA